jgi:hypothetical protein
MASTFRTAVQKNVGNTWTILNGYVVGSNVFSSIILGLAISNTTGSSITANVGIFTGNYAASGNANIYLVYSAPISSGGTLIPIGVDQKVVLASNNSIFVQTSASNSADAVMSVLEIT